MIAKIDSSKEMLLRPHLNGVEFIRQTENDSRFMTFGELTEAPMAVYIMTTESAVFDANQATLDLNQVSSLQKFIGATSHDCWKGEQASNHIRNDKNVMQKQELLITDDSAVRCYDESYTSMLSFKMPLYREAAVIGVLGFTLQIDANIKRLATQLLTIAQTGLIQPNRIKQIQQNLDVTKSQVYFTAREIEVLSLLVNGSTARKISCMLGISQRTVEHHIENMKQKAGCHSKFELIDKFHWQIKLN